MFWNFFDEDGVHDTHKTAGNVTHYSDGRSSYDDSFGNTHYSDGSVAYNTFRGDREYYKANGEYEKSSYVDGCGITRYYK